MFILIVCAALLCIKIYIDNRSLRAETLKLEAKIEMTLKKHPNKTTLVQFLQNQDIIYGVTKTSDALKYDDPYPYSDAPSDAYWIIGIIAVGPIGFGKSYTVFVNKKGKFLTYQSYELTPPGLDF